MMSKEPIWTMTILVIYWGPHSAGSTAVATVPIATGPALLGARAVFCKSGPMNWNVQPLKRYRHGSAADGFKVKGDKAVRTRQYSNTHKPNVRSNIAPP